MELISHSPSTIGTQPSFKATVAHAGAPTLTPNAALGALDQADDEGTVHCVRHPAGSITWRCRVIWSAAVVVEIPHSTPSSRSG